MPALELAADDHTACRIDAVDLKNLLGNIETNRRDRLHAHLLPIVVTPSATTSMALTCRWRSRPQHQKLTPARHRATYRGRYSGSPALRRPSRKRCKSTSFL